MLSALGSDDKSWLSLNNTARYISHGNEERPTVFMSAKGYQILVPCGIKVMSCTVMPYGNYLQFENTKAIDYIFRNGRM